MSDPLKDAEEALQLFLQANPHLIEDSERLSKAIQVSSDSPLPAVTQQVKDAIAVDPHSFTRLRASLIEDEIAKELSCKRKRGYSNTQLAQIEELRRKPLAHLWSQADNANLQGKGVGVLLPSLLEALSLQMQSSAHLQGLNKPLMSIQNSLYSVRIGSKVDPVVINTGKDGESSFDA